MIIGYARVSTKGQDLMPQINVLEEYGCEKIFQDEESSTMKNRPGFEDLKKQLRKGDLLVVPATYHIFKTIRDMVSFFVWLESVGAHFKSLREPIFDTCIEENKRFIFKIFRAVDDFEKTLMPSRTNFGLERAEHRKIYLGRKNGIKKDTIEKCKKAYKFYHEGKMSILEACKKAEISKATYYRVQTEIELDERMNPS